MHTNYYFLRQLAPALNNQLENLRFVACFSQDRDEIVLVFAEAKGKQNYYKPYYIKATLRPDFSGLFFPESVQRARSNSVDLFDSLIDPTAEDDHHPGRAVLGVRSFLNERCLAITLENDLTLLFKFFGNRPNLLAFKGNTVIDLFNHNLATDWKLSLDTLDHPIDQSFDAFERADFDHRKLFPTFGKVVHHYLDEKKEPGQAVSWSLIQETVYQLEHPRYYLIRLAHKPTLSLLPLHVQASDPVVREFGEPIEAANRFFIAFNGLSTFEQEKADWLRLIDKRRKRAQAQIEGNMNRLIARDEGASHEEMGHILMANLHDIPEVPGAKSPDRVTLLDFYRDQPISIKLKPDLSPQKNAENYYRKSKNEKIEEEHLSRQVATREAEIERMDQQKADIEQIATLKELRRYVKQTNLVQEAPSMASSDGTQAQLFKEVLLDNFRILIGRNAKNNDLLTQKYTHKEDLWLHAKDVAGSHVVIKYKAGKTFPKNVIERAAELAAWYSRRRTDSLCPVTVTPKKFVRKPKGLAEGQVIVEKEEVVMVVPRGD
ncbi:NFACT RNA binding domain-containing protein [Spirosoma utsteinense]|uniref:Ribosome quality control (RQC) complex YloA/Tae2 family protein n=1 Tax=Spirosoma utsteinense TaxID=2585773 RepID=A0ABR6W0J4_9BACT|nr:NFACT RNA binding domain-containing protein [Spirosoma utsteinense]MBC3786569.1 putative ribosome quality control (RQC) complex YloA/Tae2 family protein [Spirosoma utsteinense]MBC3789947.1 putative ribosome quality control (RQC) complex YloA/Tae2 family protein [Spirosoma utsteinense]